MTLHRAVFFDRDDTLIEDPGYINDPELVRVCPDAIAAVARLRRVGYRIVVVSNQSGVARGLITEAQLEAVNERVQSLFAGDGAALDGVYSCPYLAGPEATVEAYRRDSPLRKPAPGMLLEAARELDLDLGRSWMIGDAARDVEAGRRAGCRTILLERGGASDDAKGARPTHTAASLTEAVQMVLESDGESKATPPAETSPGDGPVDHRSHELLTEIRDLMDRSSRARRQEDFSLLRLGGTLLQMLAVAAALWGLFPLFSDNAPAATARFALAGFLQLAALAIHFSGRRE
ncbi:MAG: HAD family hydrolase [bacterium]|nr:HAD family hydrolase [bacterium]